MADPWGADVPTDTIGKNDPWSADVPTEDWGAKEKARQTALSASLHPMETAAAMQAADLLSPMVHPQITAQNPEIVSKEMYGAPVKATGFLEKIKNGFRNAGIDHTLNDLYAREAVGSGSAQDREDIDRLKRDQAPPDKTIQGFPKFVLDFLYTNGYALPASMGGQEEALVKGTAAGIGNALLNRLSSPGTNMVREMMRQGLGAHYRSALEAGINQKDARIVGFVLTGIDTAINAVGGKGASKVGTEVVERGITRTLLSPDLARTVAKGIAGQGAYNYGMAVANIAVTNIAKAAEGKPTDQFSDMLKDLVKQGTPGMIVGTAMVAGHVAGNLLPRIVEDATNKSLGVSAGEGEPSLQPVPPGEPVDPNSGILPTQAQRSLVESPPNAQEPSPVTTVVNPVQPEGKPPFRSEEKFPLRDSKGDPVGPRQQEDVIYVGETPVDKRSFETNTLAQMKKPAMSKKAMSGASLKLGVAIRRLWGRGRGTANVLASSYDYNGELVFGGKNTDAYKTAVGIPREQQLKIRPMARDLAKPVMEDWAKENGMGAMALGHYAMKEMTIGKRTLNKGEVWSAWLHFQNEDNRASLLKGQVIRRAENPRETMENPISEEEFRAFFAKLEPNELEGLRRMQEALSKAGDIRGEDYQTRHGAPMERPPNYWPKDVVTDLSINKLEGFNVEMEKNQENDRHIKVSPSEAHSIARENVVVPLYLENAFQRFPEAMHDTSLIVNMATALEQAGKVVWNTSIADRIDHTWGTSMRKSIQDNLMQMAGRGQSSQAWMNMFDTIRDLTITMDLGLNLKTGVKQILLGGRSWGYVRSDAWLNGLLQTIVHPVRTRKIAESTSLIYNEARRTGGTIEANRMLADQNNLRRSGVMGTLGDIKSVIRRSSMFITKAGSNYSFKLDTTAAHNGAAIEFRNVENGGKFSQDFKAATGLNEADVSKMTPEDKLKAGGKFADYIIGETHATALSVQQAGVMKNPLTRLAVTFKAEGMKAFEAWRRAVMQAHRDPNPRNITKAVKSTFFYMVAEPLIFYGLDYAYNALLDRRNKKGKPVRPNLAASAAVTYGNYLLGAGDMIQGVTDRLQYGSFAASAGINVSGQVPSYMIDGVVNAIKASTLKNTADRSRAWQAFVKDAVTLGLSIGDIPYQAPQTFVDSLWKRINK